MSEEPVCIATADGTLRGVAHVPQHDFRWMVVVLQGYFSCTHVGPARLYVQLARLLAGRAVLTLRVNCRGAGDSDGELADTTPETRLLDARRVLEWARRRWPGKHSALLGHSLGGNLALRLAAEDPEIGQVLLISPTCGPSRGLFTPEERSSIQRAGGVERKSSWISSQFLEAVESAEVFSVAAAVAQPVVVFRAEADEYQQREQTRRLLQSLRNGKLVELPGADHNFLRPGARQALLHRFEVEIRKIF